MSTLSDEIANDPLVRGYASMTDLQIVASINAVDRNVDKPVALRELIVHLLKKQKWVAIEAESKSDSLGVQAETVAFMTIMNNVNFTELDLSDSITQTMLISIRDADLLDAADQIAILAMGKEMKSRAQELGLSRIREGTVNRARV